MLTVDTLQRITEFNGDGLPVLSVYARVNPANRTDYQSQVGSLLHQMRAVADDPDLSHEAMVSLRDDIAAIKAASEQPQPDALGVAYFCCSGRGLFEQVELPRPVRERIVVDQTPWVQPLTLVLEEYHRLRIAVVDRANAHFWDLYQDEIEDRGRLRDKHLRKPDYAYGDREYETRNKVETLARKHYRKVVEQLAEDARNREFDLLAVGGHEEELPEFVDFLPRDLRDKLAGTFQVDPNVAANSDRGVLVERARAILEKWERAEEERLVAETYERRAMRAPAAIGLPECLWGATTAAIDLLLVQEGAQAPGVVCDESGWLGLRGDTCPICGKQTRETPDVVDELVQAVMDESASVEHVLVQGTRLESDLVAAKLRFPLPPAEFDQA
ncbi:baeRF10 domain-containing protein [Pseudonocardia bannensis]|uniref:Peptide chain release factor subunit 1 n=1 Tax=Pseudonocardia bannensis TaxID=630973 RepID=A0A848DF78_9PSEU|nr:hypothetical protein [Pseudonocardia bannensis]NMH91298.1 hypothetical protein [Pseudonocardia bannensis]